MANLILKPLVSVLTAKCYKSLSVGVFNLKPGDIPPSLPPVPIPPGG